MQGPARRCYDRLHGDPRSSHPGKVREALGREIVKFQEAAWLSVRAAFVAYQCILQKLGPDTALRQKLKSSQGWVLAEATRRDSIWGIGMDVIDAKVADPALWKGPERIRLCAHMRPRCALRRAIL